MKTYRIAGGWLEPVRRVPSPNCGPRPEGCRPDLLVIHNISLPPGEFGGDYIEALFTNSLDWDAHPYFSEIRDLEVSAHVLIRRDGEVVQFVNFNDRAWHAGESCFRERDNCNDFSIGIELEGTDEEPYKEAQYEALVSITLALQSDYPEMDASRIAGHCDIAPGRKSDPGASFDWKRYLAGLG